MKWIRDATGRVAERPHYEPAELDREFESLVAGFLRRHRGAVAYPLGTDDLTVLIEQETSDLDLYADLAAEGAAVEGVTEFWPDRKPSVRVSAALSASSRGEHRLRSTLAHELGHVRLHGFLWSLQRPAGARAGAAGPGGPRCRRETVLRAGTQDWLEWQAGYAGGAVLMPAGALATLLERELAALRLRGQVFLGTRAATGLCRAVQRHFAVSQEAARIRLLKLGYLTKLSPARSLFTPRSR